MSDPRLDAPRRRAAQYVRMSTDMQRYSIQNQSEAIATYALLNGIQLVRYYSDEGRSGLTLKERPGLRSLLSDVQAGRADYEALLVYDVSRWGRFQDTDESAHYEHLCRRAGVQVIYCAEQFANDGSLWAAVIKSLKRAMAAEYSRELSDKVFRGQVRLVQMGIKQNGPSGYGLRRQLVDHTGTPKTILRHGEHKSIASDRVVLVPGPPEELAVVHEIFELFIGGTTELHIAELLNERGLKTERGRPWTRQSVRGLLNSPKYMGDNVYNRCSFKLHQTRVKNPPDEWIRLEGAFKPVVSRELYNRAQHRMAVRRARLTDDEMLAKLRALIDETGTATEAIISARADMPNPPFYRARFGSLKAAIIRTGHFRERGPISPFQQAIRTMRPRIAQQIAGALGARGYPVEIDPVTGFLITANGMSVGIYTGHFCWIEGHVPMWTYRIQVMTRPDLVIAVRFDAARMEVEDYFCIDGKTVSRTYIITGNARYRRKLQCSGQAEVCARIIAAERGRAPAPNRKTRVRAGGPGVPASPHP